MDAAAGDLQIHGTHGHEPGELLGQFFGLEDGSFSHCTHPFGPILGGFRPSVKAEMLDLS